MRDQPRFSSGPAAAADLELTRAALRGERPALRSFLERMRCVPRVLAVKNRDYGRALDDAELEDLVQNTLMAVWRKLHLFDGRARLETWVYRFCVIELLRRLRALQRAPASLDELERQGAGPDARQDAQAAANVEADIDREHVHASLEHLHPVDASILRLKHFEECTFVEVGRRLALPTATAKTRYYRALERLRQRLAPRLRSEEGIA